MGNDFVEYYGTDFAVMRDGVVVTIEENKVALDNGFDGNVVIAKPGDVVQVITAKKPSLGLFVSALHLDGTVTYTTKNDPYTILDTDCIIGAMWTL